MLSDLQQRAFLIHQLFTFYLLPFPLKWNAAYSELVVMKPYYKWIPWVISFLVVIIIDITLIFAVFSYGFIKPNPNFARESLYLHIIVTFTVLACVYVGCKAFFRINRYASGFNQLLACDTYLKAGLFRRS